MTKKINTNRVFGVKTNNSFEIFIKGLATSHKKCFFEKEIIKNKIYLTIKNFGINNFDIKKYVNLLKGGTQGKNYIKSILIFPETEKDYSEHKIESEFLIKNIRNNNQPEKTKNQNFEKNKNFKIIFQFNSNSLTFIIKELLAYIDKMFVDDFYRNSTTTNFKNSNEKLHLILNNFCEQLNIDNFIKLIDKWKNLKVIENNYSEIFEKRYKIFNLKRQIIIIFKKRNSTPIKKR